MEGPSNGQLDPAAAIRQRDLVVVGASAGGVEALQAVVAGLPPEFPASILVVLHVAAAGTSVLPQILARKGPLPAVFATDEEEMKRGQIYVAPPDHHMLVHGHDIRVTRGPRENGHRPAIDPLFRSAARSRGAECIGVVLSGLLDDGASGLQFLASAGGATIVQDPVDAPFPSMPRAALRLTHADRIATAADLAGALCQLIEDPVSASDVRAGRAVDERDVGPPWPEGQDGDDRVELDDPAQTAELLVGPPSALTCPECGGALWEHADGEHVRFACHVGHAYSLGTLVEEQGRGLESSLWSGVRALEERADMHRRLARRASGNRRSMYEEQSRDAESHAQSLRTIITHAGRTTEPTPEPT